MFSNFSAASVASTRCRRAATSPPPERGDPVDSWTLRARTRAASPRREAIGGYDASAYQFHVGQVLYHSRDLEGSIKALQDSLRVQPRQERQGRVHSNGVLAQRQFELGHLDAACATWHRFLDDYSQISTSRGDEHFETMQRRVRPYTKSRVVRDLRERAREVATQKA